MKGLLQCLCKKVYIDYRKGDRINVKLFFVSDIHGSAYYLKKALQRFNEDGADYIVILGDELYHGARNPLPRDYNPKEVTALLNEYSSRIIAVRGNCDSEIDSVVLDFPMMSDYSVLFYNGRRLFLTHGHIYNEENMPKLKSGDAMLYGHTHVPRAEKVGDVFLINPGSITFPKENYPNSYGILKDNIFEIKNLDGKPFKRIEI